MRNEICQVVHSCTTNEIGPTDFHFINLAGKQASVPSCKEGFEWNGRAVKELAGSGAVYIRLPSSDSSSDDELVQFLQTTTTSALVTSDVVTPRQSVTSDVVTPRESVTSDVVTPRQSVTSDVVTPRESVTSDVVTPREPVTPASSFTPAPITPRALVTPAPVTPREPVTSPHGTPREPVIPSSSSSLFIGSAVTPDNDASIYIDDDLPVDASSPTVGDSVIILDNDHSNSPLDDTGDGMEIVGKSNLTRSGEMFPHMSS